MNKLIIYILLVLVYLGLSKSLSPSELGVNYVQNEQALENLIGAGPVSVILIDVHSTGFIIKTYYHKYKIVYGFQSYDELITRVSSQFMQKHEKNIGMAIFRRLQDGTVEHTPLPPGTIFIGDKNFGNWKKNNSGDKVWSFYRVYRHLPIFLGWADFVPTFNFYEETKERIKQQKAFFGFNDEFGTDGSITKKSFPNFFEKNKNKNINFNEFFKDYLKKNF